MIRIRVFDTETTGLYNNDLVVECGYHDLINDGSGWTVDRIDAAVFNAHAQGRKCHPQAFATHKITEEEIEAGWDYALLPKFLHFGSPDVYAAHNFGFDAKFFTFDKPTICTMKCAKRIWPGAPSYKNGELGVWKGISDDVRLHRVIPDTRVTSGLLKLMLEEGHTPEHLVNISGGKSQGYASSGGASNPSPLVLHFGEHRGKSMDKIPTSYLQWIVYVSECRDDVKTAAKQELDKR